jgi:putative ABC transport system permease protein
MIIEMFISLLLLFALSTMIISRVSNYHEPIGFNYNDVWTVEMDFSGNEGDKEAGKEMADLLKRNIKSIPEVLEISNCSKNTPYSFVNNRGMINYKDNSFGTFQVINTDEQYPNVLDLDLCEGRWFNAEDIGQKERPIVLTKDIKRIVFGDEPAVGKVVSGKYKVIGIVENFKKNGAFSEKTPTFFKIIPPETFRDKFIIKSEKGAGLAFEEKLVSIATSTAKGWPIEVEKLSDKRISYQRFIWIPILIFLSVCAFLIINIILGLFGTLLYNINKRRPEIGLRRSLGASTIKIYHQFIGEMLMLTTLGVIPGIIIAIQFPLLKAFDIETKIFLLAIFCSLIIIYLLVIIASYIPSRYAAKTEPAIALHEE